MIFCPLVPLKPRFAFCPGAVVVSVTGAPSIVIVPLISAGALLICNVSLPVLVELCCTQS